jgi:hypothetical protein
MTCRENWPEPANGVEVGHENAVSISSTPKPFPIPITHAHSEFLSHRLILLLRQIEMHVPQSSICFNPQSQASPLFSLQSSVIQFVALFEWLFR